MVAQAWQAFKRMNPEFAATVAEICAAGGDESELIEIVDREQGALFEESQRRYMSADEETELVLHRILRDAAVDLPKALLCDFILALKTLGRPRTVSTFIRRSPPKMIKWLKTQVEGVERTDGIPHEMGDRLSQELGALEHRLRDMSHKRGRSPKKTHRRPWSAAVHTRIMEAWFEYLHSLRRACQPSWSRSDTCQWIAMLLAGVFPWTFRGQFEEETIDKRYVLNRLRYHHPRLASWGAIKYRDRRR